MDQPINPEPDAARFSIPFWVWAVAIAAILFFVLTLWQARKTQRQLAELQLQVRSEQSRKETLETQRREMKQIRALLAAPETRMVQLKSSNVAAQPIKLFWNDNLGLLVTAQKISALPAGRAYQLWILPKRGGPISAGIFQPDANGTVLKLVQPAAPMRILDAAGILITLEPAGGSSQPTSEPSWTGRTP